MQPAISATLTALAVGACAHAPPPSTEAAWAAWRAGEAEIVAVMSARLQRNPETVDEGRHLAALSAHVRGDHAAAIEQYNGISADYPRRRELRGPVFESHLHLDCAGEAVAFARAQELPANFIARAQSRLDHALRVEAGGVTMAAFTTDALTPYMPGFAGQLNGQEVVFRIDTGGTFVAMSPALATRYGVRSDTCSQGFANLQATQVCYGVADLAIGSIRVRNAPVAVVAALPAEQLGVELGPVLGTNFLALFLSTIDAPNARLVLSPRADARARREHLRLLDVEAALPFLLWGDHFIIARGGAGARRDLNFFVDSGLVAVAADGVQAGLLAPQTEAVAWAGVTADAAPGAIATLPVPISLGGGERDDQRALILPDAAWASFGTFGGIKVHGLISYGFLKHAAWTLDFDERRLLLSRPQ